MELTSDIVYGFTGSVLAPRFDDPKPIPQFHKELWELCCLKVKKVAIAAPRGHAKSTSITLAYLLAALLFRDRVYAVIVSDTEGQAVQFLGDLKAELLENEDLIELFGVSKLLKDSETKIIVEMEDGWQFRVETKGSEQKVRGLKWRSRRPDLIICDDLENDEIVMNKERREKFRNWFFKALLPALSDSGKIIVVGTILHMDSVLERLLNDRHWYTARYAAHDADFENILWEEKFSKDRLEEIREGYINQGMPEGYSQEYLNYPIDEESAYFRRDDFRYYDKNELDYERLNYYSAIDFAISEKEKSDYTVIITVGVDEKNRMYVVDVLRGRWDGKQIIDNMLFTHLKWQPQIFTAEDGVIRKSLGGFLREEMMARGVFPNINPLTPTKDKQTRARSIQARIRQGTVYFDEEADWYPDLEQELIRFPRDVHDDQVDALSWIGLTLDNIIPAPTRQEYEEDLWEQEMETYDLPMGRSWATGY